MSFGLKYQGPNPSKSVSSAKERRGLVPKNREDVRNGNRDGFSMI